MWKHTKSNSCILLQPNHKSQYSSLYLYHIIYFTDQQPSNQHSELLLLEEIEFCILFWSVCSRLGINDLKSFETTILFSRNAAERLRKEQFRSNCTRSGKPHRMLEVFYSNKWDTINFPIALYGRTMSNERFDGGCFKCGNNLFIKRIHWTGSHWGDACLGWMRVCFIISFPIFMIIGRDFCFRIWYWSPTQCRWGESLLFLYRFMSAKWIDPDIYDGI